MPDDQSPLAKIPAADLVAELARRCGDEVELSSINLLLKEWAKRFDVYLIAGRRLLTEEQIHMVRHAGGMEEHPKEFQALFREMLDFYLPTCALLLEDEDEAEEEESEEEGTE